MFIVYVLTLLTGYRYAINTEANMWYLFSVAHSTSETLTFFGGESSLETRSVTGFTTHPTSTSAAKRAELNEWRGKTDAVLAEGPDAQPEAEPDATANATPDATPLVAWERWLYRAYSLVRADKSLQEAGPFVYFRAKAGIDSKISALRVQVNAARGDAAIPVEEGDARLEELTVELKGLEEERKALREKNGAAWSGRDTSFGFTLVPDCGAIPSLSIFMGAVLAFPTAWWRRILGLVVGMPFLYGVNVARLASLAVLGAYDTTPGGKWFDFVHHYVWQGVFIIFVVAVWLAWIECIVKRRSV
jgi:exosortase/archaeosortase family protein